MSSAGYGRTSLQLYPLAAGVLDFAGVQEFGQAHAITASGQTALARR
ncbi:MAG: hypothetical protein QGF79_04780 [Arenicellales bacterium]|jgi:hypothetical protein|nr:hypothetical protein [Arenicellales bacterium]|tara:strand:+ start:1271 stop:1411 length:141 start_codon:yes stop_codon:yes gene_type:complete